MKRAKVGISHEYLIKLLELPEESRISEIEYDGKHCCINLYLYNVGKEMPECSTPEMFSSIDLKKRENND